MPESLTRYLQMSSPLSREKGLTGIGIAELMKEAGLTLGGFYKHFASRDDLVAEANALGIWRVEAQAQCSCLGRSSYHIRVSS